MLRHTVVAPGTLVACLVGLLPEASGRTRKQMLADGRVRVNGAVTRKATTALATGDLVEVGARTTRSAPAPTLPVVYEDADVIVVDKPAGLLTIATEHERTRTLYAQVTAYAGARTPPGRVFIVHRLDRDTSGLLVFATTVEAKRTLQGQLAAHSAERVYLALVEGRVARPAGRIASRLLDDQPGRVRVTRDPRRGRAAVTHWKVMQAGEHHTLLEVRLETGRRQQIRAHLAELGHPVAGDTTYGSRTNPAGRLALHAHVLGFAHPRTGEPLRFVSPAPATFRRSAV